jgi:hypothetical protein
MRHNIAAAANFGNGPGLFQPWLPQEMLNHAAIAQAILINNLLLAEKQNIAL